MKRAIQISVIMFLMIQYNAFAQWFPLPDSLFEKWEVAWSIDACDENCSILSTSLADSPAGLFKVNYGNMEVENVTPFVEWGEIAIDVSMIDKDHIWISTASENGGRILVTSNGGTSWETQFSDNGKTKFINFIKMFDPNNGIAIGDAIDFANDPAVILTTSNGGSTWESVNSSLIGASGNIWRMIDFPSASVGYFSASTQLVYDKIYKTIDGGVNWTETNFKGEFGAIQVLKFYNENLGIAYDLDLNSNMGIIYRTFNGGETWESFAMPSIGRGADFEFIPNNPNKVWFTDYYGLFFSSDTGRTWTLESSPNDTLKGRDIVFVDENNGRLLSENGDMRILYTKNNGNVITKVEEQENSVLDNFKLYQNYPNPFNPSTTISYSIPFSSVILSEAKNPQDYSSIAPQNDNNLVTLKVYDILGNEVNVLVNENKTPGNYEVKFDGTNFPSGVYYYQLAVGDFLKTNKMILLK